MIEARICPTDPDLIQVGDSREPGVIIIEIHRQEWYQWCRHVLHMGQDAFDFWLTIRETWFKLPGRRFTRSDVLILLQRIRAGEYRFGLPVLILANA